MNTIHLGTVAGVKITVRLPITLIGGIALLVVLIVIGLALFQLPALRAVLFGIGALILHYAFELAHQFGHVFAARSTGHPMIGIEFGTLGLFSRCVYPEDEPKLPRSVHLRRAFGGPVLSAELSVVGLILVIVLSARGGTLYALAMFWLIENLFVFTLQAAIPLGFNDGSSIRYWLRQPEA